MTDNDPEIQDGTKLNRMKIQIKRPNGILDHVKDEHREKSKKKAKTHTERTDTTVAVKVKKRFSKRKKILLALLFLFTLTLVVGSVASYFYIYTPAIKIRDSVNNIRAEAELLQNELENKDISNLEARVKTVRTEMEAIDLELEEYSFLEELSFTKGYYENLETAQAIIEKSDALIEDVLPELTTLLEASGFTIEPADAEEIGEVLEGSEVPLDLVAAEEDEDSSLSLILSDMSKYLQLYKDSEPRIMDLLDEIGSLNEEYIPSLGPLAEYDVEGYLNTVRTLREDFPSKADEVVSFLEYVPDLLGSNKETTYLLILQNESEMRASGGLITAYGTMTIKDGEVGEITLTDSWNIETFVSYTLGIDVGYRNIYGQNVLMNRGCGSTYLRAQDSGIYPDLNWTMNTFTDYYDIANQYDPVNFPGYDKVMMINFAFSENLLGLIQPLEVEGFGQVTADTLFNFIKAETDDRSLSFSADRKKIIEDIANAVKNKLFELEIDQGLDLARFAIEGFQAKDVAILSKDANFQTQFLDEYGMSGRFATDFNGDYLHINEAQNCSLKLNKFVRDTVHQDIIINDDGSIDKSVRIEWQNPVVYQDSLKDQYSASLNFSYRAWVRYMAPPSVSSFDSNGYFQSGYVGYFPQSYYDEVMNKSVSDNIIQFDHRRFSESDPIPTHDLLVSYSLPSELNYNTQGVYRLLLQKHPGKSWGEVYKTRINYEGNWYNVDVTLDRDKVVTFREGVITVENYDESLDWLIDLIDEAPLDTLLE